MDLRQSRRQIELVLSAQYERDDPPYFWEPERPVLLLMHGATRTDFPSITNYTFKVGHGDFGEKRSAAIGT